MKWLLIAGGGVAAWWLWRSGTLARLTQSLNNATGSRGPVAVAPMPQAMLAHSVDALAALPDANTQKLGTISPDGRYVVQLANRQTGGYVWAPLMIGGPVLSTTLLAAGAHGIG